MRHQTYTLPVTSALQASTKFAGMLKGYSRMRLGVSAFKPQANVTLWVGIEGERLIWAAGDPLDREFQPQLIEYDGALDVFLRIRTPEHVRRFAARFGPLVICEHGLPYGTERGCQRCRKKSFTVAVCPPRKCALQERAEAAGVASSMRCDRRPRGGCWNQFVCWEPIAGWLWLVSVARAVLDAASAVHRGARPDAQAWTFLWENFRGYHYGTADPRWAAEPKFSVAEGRWVVSGVVGWWLGVVGVAPSFFWDDQGSKIEFWGGTLGALGLQLIRAVSRAHALSGCSGCGDLYVRPNRAPQAGRPNYCPSCGPATANRLRQRAHRAKAADGHQ